MILPNSNGKGCIVLKKSKELDNYNGKLTDNAIQSISHAT